MGTGKGALGLVFGVALMAGFLSPAFVNARGSQDPAARIDSLELQIRSLGQSLNVSGIGLTDATGSGAGDAAGARGVLVAQSRDVASLNVRLSQIEEQMRILTGQVEGLQFQMTQFQTLIERMQEDNEFRFQQLEGGGPGKTEAAVQSGGARPAGELPQTQMQDLNGTGDAGGLAAGNGVQEIAPEDAEVILPGSLFDADGLNEAEFPSLLQGGGQALDLDFDPGAVVRDGDAEAQYRAGFQAVLEGDYDFAQMQFAQFIALFPDDPQAPDATNWLGESLLQLGRYDEAAQVLFAGFQKYQDTVRAPDLLLRLGVALAGAGERETACRTYVEVMRRYPDMGEAFNNRVGEEVARAQC